jgi:hypothetical protein
LLYNDFMSKARYLLLIEEDLKAKLESTAKDNFRSLASEINFRLEQSLRRDALEIGSSSAALGQTSRNEDAHEVQNTKQDS